LDLRVLLCKTDLAREMLLLSVLLNDMHKSVEFSMSFVRLKESVTGTLDRTEKERNQGNVPVIDPTIITRFDLKSDLFKSSNSSWNSRKWPR